MMLKSFNILKKQPQFISLLNGAIHTSTKVEYSNSIQNYKAQNEPILDYKTNSVESNLLKETLSKYLDQTIDIPIVIGNNLFKLKKVKKYNSIECVPKSLKNASYDKI